MSGCAAAGAPDPPAPSQLPATYVLEQEIVDRWMHAAQRPEFTPFARWTSPLYLRLGAPDARTAERTVHVAFRAPTSADSASLRVDRRGRIVRHDAWAASLPPAAFMLPGDSARFARFRLRVNQRLMLPLARVWDLVPRVHPRRFVAGARWIDTLALSTDYEGSRQALTGVRTNVLVRDTSVAGRRLWIVRDSADVRYTERELEHERTLDTLVTIDRATTGTVRGTYLFDPAIGFLHAHDDTTVLSGEAILRYPDGRSFTTPVRYERTRRWRLHEPSAFASLQAERRAELMRSAPSGAVATPRNDLERRLASNDGALRDSLTAVWESERDPNRREELYRSLTLWVRGAPSYRTVLDARRIAAGDSALWLRRLAERAYPARPPIDADAARQMIRVMNDPAIPWALGAARDPVYENLIQTLTTWPPAITPDSSRWPCTPDACRLLGEQWRTAREPRLRDVGLAMLVTMDPARWADTVLARAETGAPILRRVAQLVNGVGAIWPAAAQLPLPGADADWRTWIAWSNAPNPNYRPPPSMRRGRENQLRLDESHTTAIRFFQARTGRDVIGELRRHRAAATDDSARMVYGAILTELGDVPSVGELAAQLRSGSAPEISLASATVPKLLGPNAPPADSATTVEILDRLLASLLERGDPWPPLRRPTTPAPANPPRPAGPVRPPLVLADSIPAVLREKWRDRLRFITADEWRRMPEHEAAMMMIPSRVARVGPFVRAEVRMSGRLARSPDEAPHLFASGYVYYLVATDEGWRLVTSGSWIT
ncbi:MAG: hypothetical protein K0S86_1066 [Geminicoccaceae bacterium]|nr:hypothetical protein [Geminicoccaceae bacterium]